MQKREKKAPKEPISIVQTLFWIIYYETLSNRQKMEEASLYIM